MFVVLSTHNTGHGEVTSPVQLTEDIREATKTARTIESFGYQFYSNEVGVGIYRIQPEREPYEKSEFKWFLGDTPPETVVFYRRHYKYVDECGEGWKEEWFDSELQQLVDGAPVAEDKFQ